ncbi:hypothetical protein DPMN_078452 [Dreissena polymorpha]|uniref:Uncharacterized protein n=1 Tax=Dreissena polymorpha TaxID=45954 RepID=A0A9D3YNU9_DREPO|nr:hypothetical protein DPMN_078452 [Dreissena polymorpha]
MPSERRIMSDLPHPDNAFWPCPQRDVSCQTYLILTMQSGHALRETYHVRPTSS